MIDINSLTYSALKDVFVAAHKDFSPRLEKKKTYRAVRNAFIQKGWFFGRYVMPDGQGYVFWMDREDSTKNLDYIALEIPIDGRTGYVVMERTALCISGKTYSSDIGEVYQNDVMCFGVLYPHAVDRYIERKMGGRYECRNKVLCEIFRRLMKGGNITDVVGNLTKVVGDKEIFLGTGDSDEFISHYKTYVNRLFRTQEMLCIAMKGKEKALDRVLKEKNIKIASL